MFVEGCIFLTSAVAQQQRIQKYWDQGTSEKFDLLQKKPALENEWKWMKMNRQYL